MHITGWRPIADIPAAGYRLRVSPRLGWLVAVIVGVVAVAGCGGQSPDSPVFDCAKSSGQLAAVVCTDSQLAQLNQQLGTDYQTALSATGADGPALHSAQQSWVHTRDTCRSSSDTRACLLQAYQTRLVELAISRPDTPTPISVHYTCGDTSRGLSVAFYNNFEPAAAVLTWGSEQAILFQQRMGSGIRYTRDGVEYREHQGKIHVSFHGTELDCTAN